MFRRLYWIVEQLNPDGTSRLTGIYTSIPDLVGKGLKWSSNVTGQHMRLTLVKPDTFDKPLGCWSQSNLSSLQADMQDFIHTHEFSEEEVNTLCQAVDSFVA